MKKQIWAKAFQDEVRNLGKELGVNGLTVLKMRSKVQVKLRNESGQSTVIIPFDWSETKWGDAYTRVRKIAVLIQQGHGLIAAAKIAQGQAPKEGKDWKNILESFEDQKTNFGNSITEKTWKKDYKSCVMAVEVMAQKNPPTTAKDLIDICLKDFDAGSRTRQIRARALSQFLTYAVTRENLPDTWLPPKDLKQHIGRAKKGELKTQKGDPFSEDTQILDLLASLPTNAEFKRDSESATRWFNALCMMSELGLRPNEVGKMVVKKDPATKEYYWWCTYEKKAGGGTTKPRKVEPLPLIDRDGKEVQWNLLERFRSNLLPLPDKMDGESCKDYLSRREGWKDLKEMMLKKEGANIVPYSFRHYYSLRGHIAGIDSGSMAKSMGHSIEAHHRNYPYSSEASTTNAFRQARERLTA